MRTARTVIEGRLVEFREGELTHMVLVDGRPVSKTMLGGLAGESSHFFDVQGDDGKIHHAEAQFSLDWMLRGWVKVLIGGVQRDRLRLRSRPADPRLCPKCRYSLVGAPTDGENVRCPECGRDWALASLGLRSADELRP